MTYSKTIIHFEILSWLVIKKEEAKYEDYQYNLVSLA